MIFTYRGQSTPMRILIHKGLNKELEDFSRANLKVWLVGTSNQIPINYVVGEDRAILCDIPSGLAVGAYSVKAIWSKNGMECENHPHCHAVPRALNYAYESDVFTVTLNQSEATFVGSGKRISVQMFPATYGYDGLSAYEIAVLRGNTTLSESEWVGNLVELNETLQRELGNIRAYVSEKFNSLSEALKQQHKVVTQAVYKQLALQDSIDDTILYGIQDGDKITNVCFGKLPLIKDEVTIVGTEYGAWKLDARISTNVISEARNEVTLDGTASRSVVHTFSNGAITSTKEVGTVAWLPTIGSVNANKLEIPANTTGEQRTITVTASVGSGDSVVTKQFTIIQEGITAITVSPTASSVGANGGDVEFDYTTTGPAGTITVTDEQHSGIVATITGTIASGTIKIPIPENPGTTMRIMNFTVKSENCADVVLHIYQNAPEASSTPSETEGTTDIVDSIA